MRYSHILIHTRRAAAAGMVVALAVGIGLVAAPGPAGATSGTMMFGVTTNNAGTAETWLVSAPVGDKATFVVKDNNTTASTPPSDGLRVFAKAAGGAGVQSFSPDSLFSSAPTTGIAFRGIGANYGLIARATADGATGVDASATGTGFTTGVNAAGYEGIVTTGTSTGIIAHGNIAVFGRDDTCSNAPGSCEAIHGRTGHGTALVGDTDFPDAYALKAFGQVQFSTAGIATITSGTSSTTVSPGIDITADTKVLCTVMTTGGVLRNCTRNMNADTIVIKLTANATARTLIAYFVIS